MVPSHSVLLYVHVPKAAGTTMSSLLYEQIKCPGENHTDEKSFFYSGVFYHPAGYVTDLDPRFHPAVHEALSREDLRAVLGHFSFGLHQKLTRPYRYVTILREPVSRILSLYHFQRLNEAKYGHLYQVKIGENTDIAQFVMNPPYTEIDNGMTRRISGQSPTIGTCDKSHLEQAIANLKTFAVVGLSDYFDETIVMLADALGWNEPPLYYPKNVNTERPAEEILDPEVRALIEEHNALDVELYKVASEIFQEHIARMGDAFRDKLKQYRARKQTWYDQQGI